MRHGERANESVEMEAKAIRMLKSNKKKRAVHQFLCLSSFYHFLFVEQPGRALYDSYSVLVFSTILNSPVSIYAKALHFSWQHKRLFLVYCRFFSVKCAFSHATQTTYLHIIQTYIYGETRKFVDFLFHFFFFFSYRRICTQQFK